MEGTPMACLNSKARSRWTYPASEVKKCIPINKIRRNNNIVKPAFVVKSLGRHSLFTVCMYNQFPKHWGKKQELLFVVWENSTKSLSVTKGSCLKWYLDLRLTSCFSWCRTVCLSGKFYVWGSGRRWWPCPLNVFRWLIFRMLLAFFQLEAWPLDKLNMVAICKTDESRNSKRKWETQETYWNSLKMKS